jgi:hypothetical protein
VKYFKKKVKSPPFPTPWLTQEGLYNAHLLWTEVAMVLAVSQVSFPENG